MLQTLVAVVALIGSVSAPSVSAEFQGLGPPPALVSGYRLPPAPASPVSQQSAVRKAQDYLSVMGFSRLGLINQLVSFDQFSSTDATAAVDSLDVDWNEQAARKAQDYLGVMGFSRPGLISQLVSYDQFTPSQAAYGASAVGL